MKSNFDRQNYSNLGQARQKLFLSSSCGSKPSSLSLDAVSVSSIYNSEKLLRDCIREKASQGDYAVAISLLDKLIVLCPNNAVDYNNRGLMYFRNNQIIEALGDLSQALAINPNLDSAYNNRANCYAAQGELSSAIADYDLALDLNPANLRAWINQGITFRELRLYDLALENFEIALIIGDTLEERIYSERGRTYHLRGDWNCAVGDYQKALDILATKPKLAKYRLKVTRWLDDLLCPLTVGDC